jgi:hypothetical protein
MPRRAQASRRSLVRLERLESRLVLAPPGTLTIPLDPDLDQFGDQVLTVQGFGNDSRSTFGILDTGSSAVTFSPDDQAGFTDLGNGIPVKVPGGAVAEGIGGTITGDVSQPGVILADGMHIASLTFDAEGFPIFDAHFTADSASTPGIQTFVGTYDGSPDLPTITGTPELHPSATNPGGLAAKLDLQGYQLDFSDLYPGLTLAMPDLHFVPPGTAAVQQDGTTAPIYVPLGTFGGDNYSNPGDVITESQSPSQDNVTLAHHGATDAHLNFLLDTGAQLTVISTQVAQDLGLDLDHPDYTIDVQGVAGTATVPGFTIDQLDLPRSDGGILRFTHVPVYVLDVDPALDGILGTNLWNTASTMVIDPYNPGGGRLGLTFFTNPDRSGDDPGGTLGGILRGLGGAFGGAIHGHNVPGYDPNTAASIQGEVFQDANGNGARNVNEPGAAGVTVYLDRNNNGKLDPGEARTVADASGDWWFAGLAPGNYVVREVVPAGWSKTMPSASSYPVHVNAHQHAEGYRFGNFKLASISGVVFNDRNRNGRLDGGEAGLKGITVFLDLNKNGRLDAGEPRFVTSANGAYIFNNLAPGTYTVREVVPAGWRLSAPAAGSYTVTPTSGQAVTGDQFGNYRPGLAPASLSVGVGIALAMQSKSSRAAVADAVFASSDFDLPTAVPLQT